jgi:hypothetical protein
VVVIFGVWKLLQFLNAVLGRSPRMAFSGYPVLQVIKALGHDGNLTFQQMNQFQRIAVYGGLPENDVLCLTGLLIEACFRRGYIRGDGGPMI